MRTTPKKYSDLPAWPALLRIEMAAAYLDLSVEEFERAVRNRDLPAAGRIAGQNRWSRVQLDQIISREELTEVASAVASVERAIAGLVA